MLPGAGPGGNGSAFGRITSGRSFLPGKTCKLRLTHCFQGVPLFWLSRNRLGCIICNRLPVQQQDEPLAHGSGPNLRASGGEVAVSDGAIEKGRFMQLVAILRSLIPQPQMCIREIFDRIEIHQTVNF